MVPIGNVAQVRIGEYDMQMAIDKGSKSTEDAETICRPNHSLTEENGIWKIERNVERRKNKITNTSVMWY